MDPRANTPSFNGDFYLATATVIPVLWLSAGLASSAVGYLADRLRARGGLQQVTVSASLPWLTTVSRTVDRVVAPTGAGRFLRVAFLCLFILSGAVGEVLAIIVLYQGSAPSILGPVVLSATLVLIVLSAILLAMAMVLASAPVRAQVTPEPRPAAQGTADDEAQGPGTQPS